MKREMLLERAGSQTRLAVMEDGRLCEIYYERGSRTKLAGNIYAGRVQNVLPGMNAAFVDIGMGKNAFLYAGDIGVDTRDDEALRSRLEGARIEKLVRPGQMILVQVVKEPGGSKGPRVSCSVTMPGRFCVLLPTIEYVGVSRKINGNAERSRLQGIAQALVQECGAGMIVRTAAEDMPAEQIEADYRRLLRMWEKIRTEGQHSAKPRLIGDDGSLALRTVRDLMDESVERVCTDDEELCRELRTCADMLSPELSQRIEYLSTDTPLFDLARVDHQLDKAFSRHVYLKSGGTIVIDETEAMTVIDVNTGKFTGRQSLQETIFALNCEAAEEIARQLRLRDLGGIIIIDFIDMERAEDRAALVQHLKDALAADRNHTNVLGMTSLGLVEMTRRKLRRPLTKQLMRDCSACLGAGFEWTHESTAYRIFREVWRRRRLGDRAQLRILTGEKVASWLKTAGFDDPACSVDASGSDAAYEIITEF